MGHPCTSAEINLVALSLRSQPTQVPLHYFSVVSGARYSYQLSATPVNAVIRLLTSFFRGSNKNIRQDQIEH